MEQLIVLGLTVAQARLYTNLQGKLDEGMSFPDLRSHCGCQSCFFYMRVTEMLEIASVSKESVPDCVFEILAGRRGELLSEITGQMCFLRQDMPEFFRGSI